MSSHRKWNTQAHTSTYRKRQNSNSAVLPITKKSIRPFGKACSECSFATGNRMRLGLRDTKLQGGSVEVLSPGE